MSVTSPLKPADAVSESFGEAYRALIGVVENMHCRLLDVIKYEIDRHARTEMTAIQALLLYYIGSETLSAGDLRRRGYYMGSNVSYNLKKLTEGGFIDHQRNKVDRRAVQIKLTPAGLKVHDVVKKLFERQANAIGTVCGINAEELLEVAKIGQRVERFWTDSILYRN